MRHTPLRRSRSGCKLLVMVATANALLACSKAPSRTAAADASRPVPQASTQSVAPIDWSGVDSAAGRPGVAQPGDVHRFNFPRSDLHVTVGGVPVKPALALGGWVAMKQAGPNEAIATGDLVLSEREVGPVFRKLRDGGVEPTALHNHLLNESPRVLYLHVHARGDPMKIASVVRAAVALTATPAPVPPGSRTLAGPMLDTTALGVALGQAGKLNGVVYQVSVPRAEDIRDGGTPIPPAMGLGTSLNFQPTTAGKAVATGDFVLIGTEVDPVIEALASHGISITALHSHMLTEEPRLFFLHFWGNGDAAALAKGLRAALDRMNIKRTQAGATHVSG